MRKLVVLAFCLLALGCFAQRTYHFDYALDYYVTHFKHPEKSIAETLYTNSRDNSFFAEILHQDGPEATVTFLDHKTLGFRVFVDPEALKYAIQNINCQNISRYHNPYKYQTENYHYKMLNDTLISGVRCKQFVLQSNSKARARGKKAGKYIYIFSPVIYHKPILYVATAYEEWKINKVLPQGLLIETHFYNYKGELEFSEKVVNINSTGREFIIPKYCAY